MGEGFKDMIAVPTEKPDKEPPRVHIDLEQMPSMKGWKLGKTYALKARLVSKVEALDDRPECYDFEIVGGNIEKDSKEEEMSEKGPTNDDNSSDENYGSDDENDD